MDAVQTPGNSTTRVLVGGSGGASRGSSGESFRTALSYALLVLCVPVLSFFVSRSLLFAGLLNLDTGDSTLYAVAVTVVVVHVTLAVYLLRVVADHSKDDKHD